MIVLNLRGVMILKAWPNFESIRSDRRVIGLMEKVGLRH